MEKLVRINTTAVPLPQENVDTDQIIPARFLKAITRDGFGENLFRDWRYDKSDQPIEDFVLNNDRYSGKVLVAGKNFGCGSSREHAAWSLTDYGFRIVVSSFFADIFKSNALNNGLLPITVTDEELHKIFVAIEHDPKQKFELDVVAQSLKLPGTKIDITFEIDAYKKECLIQGYDDIDYLINLKSEISIFEGQQEIY